MRGEATSRVESKQKGRFRRKVPSRLSPRQLRESRVISAGEGEKIKFCLVDEESVLGGCSLDGGAARKRVRWLKRPCNMMVLEIDNNRSPNQIRRV